MVACAFWPNHGCWFIPGRFGSNPWPARSQILFVQNLRIRRAIVMPEEKSNLLSMREDRSAED